MRNSRQLKGQLGERLDVYKRQPEINQELNELTKLLGKADRDIQMIRSLITWKNIEKEEKDAIHS